MLSCAYAAGVRAGDIVLLNLMYEVSDLCTSIIVRLPNGTNKVTKPKTLFLTPIFLGEMLQARNLDFGLLGFAEFLRNMTARIEWQSNGQTVYSTAGEKEKEEEKKKKRGVAERTKRRKEVQEKTQRRSKREAKR